MDRFCQPTEAWQWRYMPKRTQNGWLMRNVAAS
jgi:hypothetical protein